MLRMLSLTELKYNKYLWVFNQIYPFRKKFWTKELPVVIEIFINTKLTTTWTSKFKKSKNEFFI